MAASTEIILDLQLDKEPSTRIGIVLKDGLFKKGKVYVDTINDDGPVAGCLMPHDTLLLVNGVTPSSADEAAETIIQSAHLTLRIKRKEIKATRTSTPLPLAPIVEQGGEGVAQQAPLGRATPRSGADTPRVTVVSVSTPRVTGGAAAPASAPAFEPVAEGASLAPEGSPSALALAPASGGGPAASATGAATPSAAAASSSSASAGQGGGSAGARSGAAASSVAAEPSSGSTLPTKAVEVKVPEGAAPGSEITVTASDGQQVTMVVPADAEPGKPITLDVPVVPTGGSSGPVAAVGPAGAAAAKPVAKPAAKPPPDMSGSFESSPNSLLSPRACATRVGYPLAPTTPISASRECAAWT